MADEAQLTWDEWIERLKGSRIWIGGHNLEARRVIEPQLMGCTRPPTGPLDAAFICPETANEAEYFATKLRNRVTHEGTIWIVMAGMDADSSGTFNASRPSHSVLLAATGLMHVAEISIDALFVAVSIGFPPSPVK